jgi:hypothetical protein
MYIRPRAVMFEFVLHKRRMGIVGGTAEAYAYSRGLGILQTYPTCTLDQPM